MTDPSGSPMRGGVAGGGAGDTTVSASPGVGGAAGDAKVTLSAGGGAGLYGVPFGGSSNGMSFAFRQGSQEWLLWEILTELKAIRRAIDDGKS